MSKTLTIVLADDKEINLRLLERRLRTKTRELPVEIIFRKFLHAQEAVDYLNRADNEVHVVVTDFDFEEFLNGTNVIHAANERGGVITFLLSGGGYSAQSQVAIDAADAFFQKPDQIDQLTAAVFDHLQHLVRLRANGAR